jgi:Na+/H+-dicarboxylate symporter
MSTIFTRIAAAGLAAAAIAGAAPTLAQARYAPGDTTAQQTTTRPSSVQLNLLDQLGPKYVTVTRPASSASTVAPASGFDWTATGAGLGAAAFALALGAGALAASKRRRESRPEPGSFVNA